MIPRDPNAGKYKRMFAEEFKMAEIVLKPYGGKLSWSTADYEAFRFISDDVCILFYPHKNSKTFNVSCRVREQASKNKELANALMLRLAIGSGHNNTFHQKNTWNFDEQQRICEREKIQMGWALDAVRKVKK